MRTPKLTKINPACPASPEQSRREQRRRVILSIYAIGKNSPRIFAFSACSAVRRIGQPDKNMQNEPNFAQRTPSIKYPESRIEQILQNEPNYRPINHFINEQRTKNYEQLSNEPNFKNTNIYLTSLYKMVCANFHPINHQKNEPNLCKTNPILSAVAYLAKANCVKTNNEQITHLNNEQRTMNYEQFSNEPNQSQFQTFGWRCHKLKSMLVNSVNGKCQINVEFGCVAYFELFAS